MSTLYTWHPDREFEKSIVEYQRGNTQPLNNWVDNQSQITDINIIQEFLHHICRMMEPYFISGTSNIFTKALNKFDVNTEDYLDYVAKREMCQNVWFEDPEDFKNLFFAYEKAFCSKELYIHDKEYKTVSDHFSFRKTNTLSGFWFAVRDFHRYATEQKGNLHNLIPNVELWLTRIPTAKEFVQPYCVSIQDKVNFSHLAYAFLNKGFLIEKDVLNLYPRAHPKRIELFEKAAQYCDLTNVLDNEQVKINKRVKV